MPINQILSVELSQYRTLILNIMAYVHSSSDKVTVPGDKVPVPKQFSFQAFSSPSPQVRRTSLVEMNADHATKPVWGAQLWQRKCKATALWQVSCFDNPVFFPLYTILDMSQCQWLVCHSREIFHLSKFTLTHAGDPGVHPFCLLKGPCVHGMGEAGLRGKLLVAITCFVPC